MQYPVIVDEFMTLYAMICIVKSEIYTIIEKNYVFSIVKIYSNMLNDHSMESITSILRIMLMLDGL